MIHMSVAILSMFRSYDGCIYALKDTEQVFAAFDGHQAAAGIRPRSTDDRQTPSFF